MGKGTDKDYIKPNEWVRDFGGTTKRKEAEYKRLPFNFCALSLAAFEEAVCTEDGIVFDPKNILPFIKRFGVHPVTGAPLTAAQLIPLHFHKNARGEYHDPVSFKILTSTTHIVAVRQTGHVYTMETIEQFNAKPKNWRDLLTDEPFQRKDIINIQDPSNLDYRRDYSKYYHVVNNINLAAEEEARKKKDISHLINLDPTAQRVLKLLPKEEKSTSSPVATSSSAAAAAGTPAKKAVNAAHFSTGAAAASLTSTATTVSTVNEPAMWHMDDVMYSSIKKKGYARIATSLGDINVELHCDLTPMTCHNFILLANRGYYKGVKFHRSIKNFMIQGGDPQGTGTGGESAWKTPFKDEFRYNLSHNARGILAMANKGPNTNSSQFFITYRPCTHLDRKHTIFGKVVGGLDVLSKMEQVETDAKERPKEPIVVNEIQIFMDPFEEWRKVYDEQQEAEAAKAAKGKHKPEDERGAWFTNPAKRIDTSGSSSEASQGVGRYLNKTTTTATTASVSTSTSTSSLPEDDEYSNKKRKLLKSTLTDFSAW